MSENAQKSRPQESRLTGFSTVSLLTLLSRVTGLGRDSLMAALFGADWVFDAFAVAFRVPNMFRRLFGEGALTAAFLPEFVQADTKGRQYAAALFNGVAWRLIRWLVTIAIVAEGFVVIVWLNLEPGVRTILLCELTMILIPYMVFVCLAGLVSAALNGVRHFFLPAMAPVLLNVIWLGGGVLIAHRFSTAIVEVRLIAVLILVGGGIQLTALLWKARHFGLKIGRKQSAPVTGVANVFAALAPVLIGLSVTQLNAILDSVLAWILSSEGLYDLVWTQRFRVPKGTASALYLGQRLMQFPLGVFAVALGTVLFPRFARHAQDGNQRELTRDILHGLQLVCVVTIPASLGLMLLAQPVTDLLFRHGQFGEDSAVLTATMMRALGSGVWVFSLLLILNRIFFATGDQRTPVRHGMTCVGLNLVFDLSLLPVLGAQALPVASILATLAQLGFAFDVLRKRQLLKAEGNLWPVILRVIVCTVIMGIVVTISIAWIRSVYFQLPRGSFRILQVVLPISAGIIVYAGCLLLCGITPEVLLKQPWLRHSSK